MELIKDRFEFYTNNKLADTTFHYVDDGEIVDLSQKWAVGEYHLVLIPSSMTYSSLGYNGYGQHRKYGSVRAYLLTKDKKNTKNSEQQASIITAQDKWDVFLWWFKQDSLHLEQGWLKESATPLYRAFGNNLSGILVNLSITTGNNRSALIQRENGL